MGKTNGQRRATMLNTQKQSGKANGQRSPTVWRCPRCGDELVAYIALSAARCSCGARMVAMGAGEAPVCASERSGLRKLSPRRKVEVAQGGC